MKKKTNTIEDLAREFDKIARNHEWNEEKADSVLIICGDDQGSMRKMIGHNSVLVACLVEAMMDDENLRKLVMTSSAICMELLMDEKEPKTKRPKVITSNKKFS